MRKCLTRAAIVVALAAGAAGFAAPATAGPDNTNTFPLDLSCSNGEQYTITVLENASQQAAVHVIGSTSVLVPTTFRFRTTVTDAGGTVLDDSTTPLESVHGASSAHHDTMECVFTQFAYHDWPEVGPVTIEVDGTVEAYIPH
jgi:hypothetical protein